jgi:hypothetical protein
MNETEPTHCARCHKPADVLYTRRIYPSGRAAKIHYSQCCRASMWTPPKKDTA